MIRQTILYYIIIYLYLVDIFKHLIEIGIRN